MRPIIAVAALLTSVSSAWAAEPSAIALAEGPPVMAGVAAFPRITALMTPATAKIDAALDRIDARQQFGPSYQGGD